MNTDRQRFRNLLTTTGTYLTSTIGIYFNQYAPSFFRFVRKEVKEHTPTTISYAFGKMLVPHHAFDIQVLNIDCLIGCYIRVRCLMQKIFALGRNLLMSFGNKYPCFSPTIRSFLLTGKTSLSAPQKFLGVSEVLRILNLMPIGINRKGFQANVNANFSGSLGEDTLGHIVAREGDKPSPGSTHTDGYRLDVTFYRTAEKELESSNVFYTEISSFKIPARLLEGEGVVSIISFEPRKTGPTFTLPDSAIECFKRFIQSLQNILKALGTHSFEFRIRFLKIDKLLHLLINGNGYPVLSVYGYPLVEGKVVERSTCLKPLIAISFCSFIYLCLIEIGLSHLRVLYIYYYTEKMHIQKIKTLNAMLYFPMAESRGFTSLSGKLF
jgi:hypothetical protein